MKLTIGKEKRKEIPEGMFGIFFEDINYSADGGLYAEMLENRAFEFVKAKGTKGAYETSYDGGYGWTRYPLQSDVAIQFQTDAPFYRETPHYAVIRTTAGEQGISNKAYEGVSVEKEILYSITVIAKALIKPCEMEIGITDKDNQPIGCTTIHVVEGDWKEYHCTLRVERSVRNGQFIILLKEKGELALTYVSMMPQNAVGGIFRRDIYQALEDLNPGFIRFPGGCVVEGSTMENRYRWKDTIAPPYARRPNWNRWAVHDAVEEKGYETEFSHYNQSLGLGFYEYFLLCEKLNAKPIPIINVGLACQFQSDEAVSVSSDEFHEYIQDALDLIEFANGGSDTFWGKKRIDMGHEASFNLEFIGIGNEQWETERIDYFRRYEIFEEQIHRIHPEIQLIGSAGPDVHSEKYEKAWNFYTSRYENSSQFVAAVDEHYYMPPRWFHDHVDFYDEYQRKIHIFAGEYAAHSANRDNNWETALAEATFMTGLEKNADIIRFAAYAPLLARIGFTQWKPDLIWFDDIKCVLTPNYYVQMLYSKYTGVYTLNTFTDSDSHGIYCSASLSKENQYYIKLINTNNYDVNLSLEFSEGTISKIKHIKLSAELSDCNTINYPNMVTPKEAILNGKSEIKIAPYSFNVLVVG